MKQGFLRLFFCAEVVLFVSLYFFGSHGRQVLAGLHEENVELAKEVIALELEVTNLDHTIDDWKMGDFYREKMAREQLQMARAGEIVYYLLCQDSVE